MKAWIWKRCSFDAAHTLPLHKGKCSKLHGHTYFVELGVECKVDPNTGMGIDMGDMGEFLRMAVLRVFDHENLNDRIQAQPTAENIAAYVIERAVDYFKTKPIKVKVFETPDSWVEVELV